MPEANPPSTERPLADQVSQAWDPSVWQSLHVVLAVSGGADSVAMLRLISELKQAAGGPGRLLVAHYDHRCRGEASQIDAEWVGRLAEQLGHEFVLGESETTSARSEEQLRNERRAFFKRTVSQCGARFLATAHTADDQAETVLFRALRGSGLAGLRGVPRVSRLTADCAQVKPLLGVTRAQIVDYLQSIDQPWREDATNASSDPTRNWIRQTLLPTIQQRFPDAPAALRRVAQHADETQQALELLASEAYESAGTGSSSGQVILNKERLARQPGPIVREAIRLVWREAGWPERDMTADHWRQLAAMLAEPTPPPREFPGAVRAEVLEDLLRLSRD